MSSKKKVVGLAGSLVPKKNLDSAIGKDVALIGKTATDMMMGAEQKCEKESIKPPTSQYPSGRYTPVQETLISFESGHYKAFKGRWKGDSVWAHFNTVEGKAIHVNKDKVEYIETETLY